nr:PPE family protein [Mycobacterium gastri]
MSFCVSAPEVTSAQIHSGPGSEPMLAAAVAWDGLGSELGSAASTFTSVISGLADGPWQGPAAKAMAAVATQYSQWLQGAAAEAGGAATQAKAVVSSFEAVRGAITHPLAVAANRLQLRLLAISNLFGFNAPAIAANECEYEAMWAKNVAAMAGYHSAVSAVAANLSPWRQALQSLPGQMASAAAADTSIPAKLSETNQAFLAQTNSANAALLRRAREVSGRNYAAAGSALRSGDLTRAVRYGVAGALYEGGANTLVATNVAAAVPTLIGLDATTAGHLLAPTTAGNISTVLPAAASSDLFGQLASTNQTYLGELGSASQTALGRQGAIVVSDFSAASYALGSGDFTGAATYATAGSLVGAGTAWSVGTGFAFAPPRVIGLDLMTAGAYYSAPEAF